MTTEIEVLKEKKRIGQRPIRLIFLYASILFLAGVDLMWIMIKKMPVSLFVVFLGLIISISLRAFAKRKSVIGIILADLILIAPSYWTFTHRTFSWTMDHILTEPTVLLTAIAILFILSDWIIRIKKIDRNAQRK